MTDDQRLGPPPIEPLSEVAWSRVERGVWAQLDAERPAGQPPPGPRRWWLAVAPLAAAAAIAALVIGVRRAPTALDEPSRVVSDTAGSSVLFGDSHIELDAATALVLSHQAEHPTVTLERGAAWFTVAPRLSRPAFIVRAGDTTVRVVGTKFRVARSGEQIAVEVDHGRVDVNFRGSEVAIGGGQRWSSNLPGQILAAAAPPPPVEPVAPGTAAQTPELPAAPEAAPAPARPAHRPARPAGSAGVRSEPRPSAAEPAMPEVDRDGAEYDRLAALEPRSPDAALAGYLALSRGTGRWADPALFAAARLAVDRHDRRAGTLLGIYLQRFPSGANATDARQLLARLQSDRRDKP